jgi:hypothetical protein
MGHQLSVVNLGEKAIRRVIWLAPLALLGFAAPAASGADDPVRLVVRASKSVLAPYEPVIVTYELENLSKEPQSVPNSADSAVLPSLQMTPSWDSQRVRSSSGTSGKPQERSTE